MILITLDELKQKLDSESKPKLAFVLGEWHFKAKRIPGSIHLENTAHADNLLNKDDEIIVYCANISCPASIYAYNHLTSNGYTNVKRFAEGIEGWETAGYEIESDLF